jgi:hypothetical protein
MLSGSMKQVLARADLGLAPRFGVALTVAVALTFGMALTARPAFATPVDDLRGACREVGGTFEQVGTGWASCEFANGDGTSTVIVCTTAKPACSFDQYLQPGGGTGSRWPGVPTSPIRTR